MKQTARPIRTAQYNARDSVQRTLFRDKLRSLARGLRCIQLGESTRQPNSLRQTHRQVFRQQGERTSDVPDEADTRLDPVLS